MFIKLCNLGRDAEVRYTNTGKPVTWLACAYSVGYGENKKTQWIEASLWGERAEKLAPHLLKGTKILLKADDLEVETYQRKDGTVGTKLKCVVIGIEFAGSKGNEEQQHHTQQPNATEKASMPTVAEREKAQAELLAKQEQQYKNNRQLSENDYSDFDDDIPFMRLSSSEAMC